jgi:hypothetical protein
MPKNSDIEEFIDDFDSRPGCESWMYIIALIIIILLLFL